VKPDSPRQFQLDAIGQLHSCFDEKFAIPRQPGLLASAIGRIEFYPPYNRAEMFRGLEDFSHLWVSFVFHAKGHDQWQPMVHPPKLGGKVKKGVFATRSPHRPNALGLSVVKLEKILIQPHVSLMISGVDILDGTPILDVKPYLPFVDSLPLARGGFTEQIEDCPMPVHFAPEVRNSLMDAGEVGVYLFDFINKMLSIDPRPAYLARSDKLRETYGVTFFGLSLQWEMKAGEVWVNRLDGLSPKSVKKLVDKFGEEFYRL
jgi:tRNA-Thr(GGU) m(6)t(6)A37 methyltransferase TsaA